MSPSPEVTLNLLLDCFDDKLFHPACPTSG